jgi:hypothetical protein
VSRYPGSGLVTTHRVGERIVREVIKPCRRLASWSPAPLGRMNPAPARAKPPFGGSSIQRPEVIPWGRSDR